jgi:membrane-bound lytic murein transglycosylase D
MMLKKDVKSISGTLTVCLSAGAALLLTTAAFASRGLIQDRRLGIEDVRGLAAKASLDGGIRLPANDLVVDRLNRFLGTPERRQQLRGELATMEHFRPMIERKLATQGMPPVLLAVPLFESGFENDRLSSHKAAGIWQFIPETARRYGLAVEEGKAVDDRLDPAKETDAAIEYLQDLYLIFQDWGLALKAYNEGERHVIELMRARHTRDPWELERAASAENYLPGAVAMMIILKNPSLAE